MMSPTSPEETDATQIGSLAPTPAEPVQWNPVGHPEGVTVTPEPADTSMLPANITPAAPGSFRAAQEETGPRQATTAEAWGAAFRQDSWVLGSFAKQMDFGPADPEHNPLDTIVGTPVEPYWHLFIGSKNQAETDYLVEKINKEVRDRQIVSAGGINGYLATAIASLASPTTLIPGGIIFRSAKIAGALAKSAASVGAAAGTATAIDEYLLQQQQATRSLGESGIAIGGSIILGGILGGMASGIASTRLARMARQIEELEGMARAGSQTDPFGAGGLMAARGQPAGMGADLSAAGVSKPRVELENTGGLASVAPFSIQDPVIRILNSPSPVARELGVETFETVLATTRNRQGITTAPAGGSIETRIKSIGDAQLGETLRITDEKFGEYYFGSANVPFRTARSTIGETFAPTGKLTHKQFREEVGRALSRNDEHPIPEVQEAAKAVRQLLDRFADDAIEVGNLDAEVVARGRPGGKSSSTYNPQNLPPPTPPTPEQLAMVRGIEQATNGTVPPHIVDELLQFLSSEKPAAQKMRETMARLQAVDQTLPNLRVVGKQDIDPADLDLVRRVIAGDQEAIDALDARAASEIDVDAAIDMARFIREVRARPKPRRLSTYLRDIGGVVDGGGDIRHMLGGTQRPGLVNQNGVDLDTATRMAWDAGYLEGVERPEINELLNALADDVGGTPRYSAKDADLADDLRLADEMEVDLAEAGYKGLSEERIRDKARKRAEAAGRLRTRGVTGESLGGPRPGEAGSGSVKGATVDLSQLVEDVRLATANLGEKEAAQFLLQPSRYREAQRMALSNQLNMVQTKLIARADAKGYAPDLMDPDTRRQVYGENQSYAPRMYNHERIAREFNRFVNIVADHFKESQGRALALLRRMEQQIAQSGGEVPKELAKRYDDLNAFARLGDDDLLAAAQDVANKILGHNPGRLPTWLNLSSSTRSHLKARTLHIADTYSSPRHGAFEDFLERDADVLVRGYTRTVVPDNEIVRRFGDIGMEEAFAKLADDYNRLKAGVQRKYQAAIKKAPIGAKTAEQADAAVDLWRSVKEREAQLKAGKTFSRATKLDKEFGRQAKADADFMRMLADDQEWLRQNGLYDAKSAEEVRARIPLEGGQAPDVMFTTREMQRELNELEKAFKRDERDLKAIVERLRGTYKIPDDPMGFLPRFGRFVRTLNFMRLLGGMTVSALTDVPRIMMTQGLMSTFRDGLVPFLTDLRAVRLSAQETKLAGTALDMVLSSRAMSIADVMDDFGRYSKFERAIGSVQDNFGRLTLMNPWNAAMKQWVGMVVQTNILRGALKVADGLGDPKTIKRLAASGISPDDARVIADQFRMHGAQHGAVYLPNTRAWNTSEPSVRQALESYRGAIVRDVDRTVVTPGQDKPLWMSTEVGKIVGQFKSFGIATVQRTMMAGMQQRDAGVLAGAISMIGMGLIVEHLKAITNEKGLPETDAQWIVTAIDRSGITGYLFEINHFAEATTGGTVGLAALTGRPVSRYASRNWADAALGPTGGLIKDLFAGTSGLSRQALAGEQINEADVRALRRALPYQNLFYLAWLFREAEGATSRALGAKPMKKNSLM